LGQRGKDEPAFRVFRFFELPTWVDTGNRSVERPCLLSPRNDVGATALVPLLYIRLDSPRASQSGSPEWRSGVKDFFKVRVLKRVICPGTGLPVRGHFLGLEVSCSPWKTKVVMLRNWHLYVLPNLKLDGSPSPWLVGHTRYCCKRGEHGREKKERGRMKRGGEQKNDGKNRSLQPQGQVRPPKWPSPLKRPHGHQAPWRLRRMTPVSRNGEGVLSCFGVMWKPASKTISLYRDTSPIRTPPSVGPYRSPMPNDLWWS